MAVIAGVDGCPSGWLCVTTNLGTGDSAARILACIDDVLTLTPRPEVLTVDVPIGLTDAGARACDLEARAKLGVPRASSVFPAPVRPTLKATTYTDACDLGAKADGRKLSRQTWAILRKIREVDTFLRSDLTRQDWVREVHPEVCFWAWNGNRAMSHRKKSPAGKAEREALVVSRYGTAYTSARSTLRAGQYSKDDLLDAFSALWTAERVHDGKALILPACPPIDSCGLRMEILA
jgi:predicted RNase H-like nuclease